MGPQIDLLVADSKFFANSFSMGFNCFVGNIQGGSDFFGRASKFDKICDFNFSGCQSIQTGRKLVRKTGCNRISINDLLVLSKVLSLIFFR